MAWDSKVVAESELLESLLEDVAMLHGKDATGQSDDRHPRQSFDYQFFWQRKPPWESILTAFVGLRISCLLRSPVNATRQMSELPAAVTQQTKTTPKHPVHL